MNVTCPKCKAILDVLPESAGRPVRCHQCATRFEVPATSQPSPVIPRGSSRRSDNEHHADKISRGLNGFATFIGLVVVLQVLAACVCFSQYEKVGVIPGAILIASAVSMHLGFGVTLSIANLLVEIERNTRR